MSQYGSGGTCSSHLTFRDLGYRLSRSLTQQTREVHSHIKVMYNREIEHLSSQIDELMCNEDVETPEEDHVPEVKVLTALGMFAVPVVAETTIGEVRCRVCDWLHYSMGKPEYSLDELQLVCNDRDEHLSLFNKTSRPRDDEETVDSLWSDWEEPDCMMQVTLWIQEKNEEIDFWSIVRDLTCVAALEDENDELRHRLALAEAASAQAEEERADFDVKFTEIQILLKTLTGKAITLNENDLFCVNGEDEKTDTEEKVADSDKDKISEEVAEKASAEVMTTSEEAAVTTKATAYEVAEVLGSTAETYQKRGDSDYEAHSHKKDTLEAAKAGTFAALKAGTFEEEKDEDGLFELR